MKPSNPDTLYEQDCLLLIQKELLQHFSVVEFSTTCKQLGAWCSHNSTRSSAIRLLVEAELEKWGFKIIIYTVLNPDTNANIDNKFIHLFCYGYRKNI